MLALVRFSLRDVLMGLMATCFILGTFRMMPSSGFAGLSVVLASSAAAWHISENDWLSLMLAAVFGLRAMYIALLLVAVFQNGDFGAFPSTLLVFAGPFGLIAGGIVGTIAAVVRRITVATLKRPVGREGCGAL